MMHDLAQTAADWLDAQFPTFTSESGTAGHAARTVIAHIARFYDPTPIDPEWLYARCDDFNQWEREFGAARVWFGRKRGSPPVGPACMVSLCPKTGCQWAPECRVSVINPNDRFQHLMWWPEDGTPCSRGWLLRLLDLWGVPIKQVEG